MGNYHNVVIGIQARSTSGRFPRKVFETIDGKPMLQHVIDAANRAAKYLNNHTQKTKVMVNVALVVPTGDEITSAFKKKVTVIEGDEKDVLSRYVTMAHRLDADYIVRLTGDCPLIPPFLISKHINTALKNELDYVSNVDENLRTSADGTDCEVMSRRVLDWLNTSATTTEDREHVTTLVRRQPPDWAIGKIGHVVGFLNLSQLKLSVDTPDDLERVRWEHDRVKQAIDTAESRHGKGSVHRF
jgi:spore coat polysaccharide biosynthesis protein SpsF (cytidylyltransferase family)